REYLSEPATPATVEYAALQLRKVLELIVMASLATNRLAVEGITEALRRKSVDDARKLARKANPEYWPKAVRLTGRASLEGLRDHEVLTEGEGGRTHGKLSELLHARTPFDPPLDVGESWSLATAVLGRLTNLLNKHVMLLAGANHLVLGQISEEG